MKDLNLIIAGNEIKTRHTGAALVFSRIPGTGQNNASRRFVDPLDAQFGQGAVGQGLEYFRKVRAQTDQNRLRFGIAKTNVVLQHTWSRGSEHQADEEHAAKGKAFGVSPGQGWLNNFPNDARQQTRIKYRAVGDGAHAARVWSRISFTDALVITRRGHQGKVSTVREKQK